MVKNDKVEKKESDKVVLEIPNTSKFILLFEEPGKALTIRTGGFLNLDEMLGFNRRIINPTLTEQMMVQAIQQQQEKAQSQSPKKEG